MSKFYPHITTSLATRAELDRLKGPALSWDKFFKALLPGIRGLVRQQAQDRARELALPRDLLSKKEAK